MSAADGASFVCVQVPPLMVEVEVVRSEHRSVHHPLEIEDLELLAVELDEAVAAKLLEGPVDVDRGEASRVGEVVLSQREIAAAVLRASDGSQTDVELDQQMRDPLVGAADRKSTRLNSSHVEISYAVFCLKKKKKVIIP